MTGANNCSRMLAEYSTQWMTIEEENFFTSQWKAVYRHASRLDKAMGDGWIRTLNDFDMSSEWEEQKHLFDRMPRFSVNRSVQGESGCVPPLSGVYVAQDDANATLQFAWKGRAENYGSGRLTNSITFSPLAASILAEIGRPALWLDSAKMSEAILAAIDRYQLTHMGPYSREDIVRNPEFAAPALSFNAFVERPCKWYFVEMIPGNFEEDEVLQASTQANVTRRLRCEAGQPCPCSGYWFSPARAAGRHHFKAGQTMPELAGGYGTTIWQWDIQQGSPKT